MKKTALLMLLTLGACLTANAEMWKWVDDDGNVHYSDKPQHASATGMSLAWSSGTNPASSPASRPDPGKAADAVASADEDERQRVKAEYCSKAKEVYRSYKEAPSLYETRANGERRYLSEKESRKLLAETKAKVAELCN